jgi:hypothetical protein
MKFYRTRGLATVTAVVSVISIAGCGGDPPPIRSAILSDGSLENSAELHRLPSCRLGARGQEAAPLVGLAAIVAGQLVQAGLNAAGTAIEEEAKQKTYSLRATENITFQEGTAPGCLYFVYGRTHSDADRGSAVSAGAIQLPGYTQEVHTQFTNNGLYLAETPKILIELVPVISGDGISYEVGYFHFGESLSTGRGSSSPNWKTLEISFRPANVAHGADKAPAAQIDLGNMPPGSTYAPRGQPRNAAARVRTMQTPWIKIDGSALTNGLLRVTAEVRVNETVPANRFFGAIGTALKGSATDAGKLVRDQIDPATRLAAETTSFQAQRTALNDYWTAHGKAIQGMADCSAATTPAQRRIKATTARAAQEDANLLAARTGKALPFPSLASLDGASCGIDLSPGANPSEGGTGAGTSGGGTGAPAPSGNATGGAVDPLTNLPLSGG